MTDRELQRHLEDGLGWEPSVDAADVGVSVDNGVVTLRGDVSTYAAKHAAERVALRVYGIKAVTNDLNVRLAAEYTLTDTDIAQAAVNALHWNAVVPSNRVTATVRESWVTLNGTLNWQYQKEAAARAVRDLTAVRGVINNIVVQPPAPQVETDNVRAAIEQAFRRSVRRLTRDESP